MELVSFKSIFLSALVIITLTTARARAVICNYARVSTVTVMALMTADGLVGWFAMLRLASYLVMTQLGGGGFHGVTDW